MYVVCVRWKVRPDRMEQFLNAAHTISEATLEHEPECFQYDVAASPERPDEVLFYEVYRSRDAHERHKTTAHIGVFRSSVDGCVESRELTIWMRQCGG